MLLVAIYAALPPSLQGDGAGWSRWVEVAVSHHGDAGTAKSRPAKRTMDAMDAMDYPSRIIITGEQEIHAGETTCLNSSTEPTVLPFHPFLGLA
ncbi:hypothetical protein CEP53_014791 [Fusarium sp. AF-6]|nr:hypothetical protein CEP53_014791 [Fusarium sp. AF-6]